MEHGSKNDRIVFCTMETRHNTWLEWKREGTCKPRGNRSTENSGSIDSVRSERAILGVKMVMMTLMTYTNKTIFTFRK